MKNIRVKQLYRFNTYETVGVQTEDSEIEYTLWVSDCPVSGAA